MGFPQTDLLRQMVSGMLQLMMYKEYLQNTINAILVILPLCMSMRQLIVMTAIGNALLMMKEMSVSRQSNAVLTVSIIIRQMGMAITTLCLLCGNILKHLVKHEQQTDIVMCLLRLWMMRRRAGKAVERRREKEEKRKEKRMNVVHLRLSMIVIAWMDVNGFMDRVSLLLMDMVLHI